MRIAVTYDNGQVFQHFGHTETFKLYEVENGTVLSSKLIGADSSGHSALAGMLSGQGVDVLICGGIGGSAEAALRDAGIELYAGASGDADAAVQAYLRGELANTGANCSHHEEEHNCGGHDDGACGGHEGGCGGCTGCSTGYLFEGKNVGRTCRTHYRGTLNDGTVFDSSYERGEPLEFVCGTGSMIRGFDAAVADMDVGQTVQVHLTPAEAYGEPDPNAIFSVEIAQLPGAEELAVDEQVYLQNMYGQPFLVKVIAKTDTVITFDANHEMAGKELNFTIELVDVLD